jgi:hypothetical protein
MVEWSVEVIWRPFFTPEWNLSASKPDERPAEWKGCFRSAVNLTMPLRVLREWHEVSRRPFAYRQFERFVSGVAFWPFDRNKSNLTLSHASPSLPVTTPTMLRGTQSIDAAVYESLTSCHSAKSHYTSTSVDMIRGHSTSRLLELLYG